MDDDANPLSLNPEFLRTLILKLRAVMAQEGAGLARQRLERLRRRGAGDAAGHPRQPDPRRGRAEIEDLEPDQQAELVALMWIGRGDMEPEEWEEALALAVERHDGATAGYLLSHPHVADHLDEGLDLLLDGTDLMETGEY